MQSDKHKWTFGEDLVCCREYLRLFVKEGVELYPAEFGRHLHAMLPGIGEGSLRMKAQNIKAAMMECGIEDSFLGKPLANCSDQCDGALRAAIAEGKGA